MQEKAASFERCAAAALRRASRHGIPTHCPRVASVVASINDQVETALPDDIRLHKLFFAPRSRFRVMTVPQLLRSGVLLSSSPIARNKR